MAVFRVVSFDTMVFLFLTDNGEDQKVFVVLAPEEEGGMYVYFREVKKYTDNHFESLKYAYDFWCKLPGVTPRKA